MDASSKTPDLDIGKVIDLTREWDHLRKKAWFEEFECEKFSKLAVETFQLLSDFNGEDYIPRDLLPLIRQISEFSVFEAYGFSKYCQAAVYIATLFCDQFNTGYVYTDEDGFFVFDIGYDNTYQIDPATFDLSHIIEIMT